MSFSYIQKAGKFLCIGRNYMAHIKELKNQVPTEPFFFLKPRSSALIPGAGPVLVPKGVVVHHEVELACVIGKTLKDLDPKSFGPKEALDAIDGYALAIDMTARNVQDAAKKKGLPWTIGKGFDTFMPLSQFISKDLIKDPYNVELNLKVNSDHRQKDLTNLMIFPIHQFLSKMSSIMTIEEGDVILTGTPKGVGSIKPGDTIEAWCSIDGKTIDGTYMKYNVEEKPGFYEFKGE
ncbi:Fmp41 protein [Martiniozyma asiatica (nom. inval.)]|nr:Fmp41 protein [Martiniozyma asiatica]